MGLFGRLFSGGAALNVLGGMAQQYNKISDEKRAEEFTLARDKKKAEAEKELTSFRARLEKDARLAAIREEFKLKKEEEKNKPKELEPALFRMDLTQYDTLPDELRKNFVVGKNINQRLKNLKDDTKTRVQLNAFRSDLPRDVLEALRQHPLFQAGSGNSRLRSKLQSAESMIIDYYKQLSGKADISFTERGDSTGKIVLAPNDIMQEMNREHPFLYNKYLKQMGVKNVRAFSKAKGITTDEKPKIDSKGDITLSTYDDAANNYSYYGGKTDRTTIDMIDNQIKNIDAGVVKGMGLASKKKYFDNLARAYGQKDGKKIPYYLKDGGFMIRSALALRQDLMEYKTPLQRPEGSTVLKVRNFFNNSPDYAKFIENPDLALAVIQFALPNNIDDSVIFEDVKYRGFVEGKPYEESVQGRLAMEQERKASRINDLKTVGFSKPEQVDFKRSAEVAKKRIAVDLRKLIKEGVNNQPAFVGLAGDILVTFKGAVSQFNAGIEVAKTIFQDPAIEEMKRVQSRALALGEEIANLRAANEAVDAKLLIDYYAEVLTFTMAATIQSGSDGSVDTRTISDADVKRIGNALRVNISNAILGNTTVIDDIITDANNKIFMLDSLTAPNRRKQSAALILNRYLENVSIFDQRNLMKYDKAPTAEELRLKEIDAGQAQFGSNKQGIVVGKPPVGGDSDDPDEEKNPFIDPKKPETPKKSITLQEKIGAA